MTADVNGFYKYTITGPTSVNVIFNNGSGGAANQTPDLVNKTNGYSYTWGATSKNVNDLEKNSIDQESYLIRLYPNPVNDKLQISATSPLSNYSILSALGHVVQEGNLNQNSIDMSKLSNGVYFITIRFENGAETMQKIIKK